MAIVLRYFASNLNFGFHIDMPTRMRDRMLRRGAPDFSNFASTFERSSGRNRSESIPTKKKTPNNSRPHHIALIKHLLKSHPKRQTHHSSTTTIINNEKFRIHNESVHVPRTIDIRILNWQTNQYQLGIHAIYY